MRIKESKNLKYDKLSKFLSAPEDYDQLELQPKVCILDRFERKNDTLIFYFKNRTQTTIKTRNIKGGREIDLIEAKLPELIGFSYEEILNTEIK